MFHCFDLFQLAKVEGGWVLEGQKRWIGNSTFADLLVILARNTTTNQVNGYVRSRGRFLESEVVLDFNL